MSENDSDGVVLLEFERGTDTLRISRKTYNGKPFTDLRIFFRGDSGQLLPTKKGCTLRDRELPQVIEELTKLRSEVASQPAAAQAQATRGEPDMSVPSPFVGIPMESKYAGKCVVCGNGYQVGDSIVYHRELKKSAHLGCGKPAPRGSR
ncbi:MAG: transcriptional coactivator p15/PC4 family protein [Polyangiaceae bacterium]|nr:transcriptional coactivator p15/PC4 family protein [Polyangiaceae bacterium]